MIENEIFRALADPTRRAIFEKLALGSMNASALRDGMDADEALDIIWFYLGYAGFFTLVDDNGWTYQKAEKWLCTAVSQALLKPSQRQKRRAPSPRK